MILAPPPVALSASPARVTLAARETRLVRVTNLGARVALVEVGRAGFGLGLRGRPRIVAARDAGWLRVRPHRLRLAPRTSAWLSVSSGAARPGDHAALVLLRAGATVPGGVDARLQVGIVVVVHVPGPVVRRLEATAARVRRVGRRRLLELRLANRGDVRERLDRVVITVLRRGRVVARLRPPPREILARSEAIADVVYRGRTRGAVTVRVLGRAFHLRL